MILSESEAKNLLTKVLSNSKADACTASLDGGNSYNIRFARNSISTNGFSDGLSLNITSYFGKRSGSASTNKFDDASIKETVKKSEDIAKLSPENKEYMPLLGGQSYISASNFSAETEKITGADRSDRISYILEKAVENNITAAGYSEDNLSFTALMNTNGLFAYNTSTMAKLSSISIS